MWNCRKCNAEVDDGFEVCWSCGTGIDGREDPDFVSSDAAPEASPAIATAEALTTIADPALPEHAHVSRRHLEAAGIGVFIADEPVSGFDWLLHRGPEPIHLQVRETDAERAKAILAEIPTEEKTAKTESVVPPPAPGVWEPENKADLDPREYIRALESKLSSVMDDHDTPDWKVNPAFHPEVNAFIQTHANNAGFLKKAQSMQQNRAKYFARIRQEAKAKAEAAGEAEPVATESADVPMCEEVPEESPKPRWRFRVPRFVFRLVKWSVILLIVAIVGVFLAATTYRQIAERELEEVIARLDETDPGWRWDDLQAKRAEVPDKENAALVVLAVDKMLGKDWFVETVKEDVTGLSPDEPINETQCKWLRETLYKHRAALLEARSLADYATGRYPSEPKRLGSPAIPLWDLVRLLSFDVILRAGTEKTADGGIASTRALLATGRSLGDEPGMILALSRNPIRSITCYQLMRTLAHGRAADKELATAQKLLEDEVGQPILVNHLKAGRAFWEEGYQDADKKGPAYVRKLFDVIDGRRDEPGKYLIVEWLQRFNLQPDWGHNEGNDTDDSYRYKVEHWLEMASLLENHALALELLTEAVELSRLPTEEQVASLDLLEAKCEAKREEPRHRWGTLPMKATIQSIREFHRSETKLRCTITALAAERYRLANEKWPPSLDALVPKYLAKVPVDPYDGKPLRLRKLDDGIVIYSIGPDREDNQGTLDRKAQDSKGKDIGFRLWDMERRGQRVKRAE